MTLKSSLCPFCSRPRIFVAEHRQWAIHLAGHREQMIQHVVENYPSCVLCTYPKSFGEKSLAAAHVRWAHKRHELINWALQNLGQIPNNQLLVYRD